MYPPPWPANTKLVSCRRAFGNHAGLSQCSLQRWFAKTSFVRTAEHEAHDYGVRVPNSLGAEFDQSTYCNCPAARVEIKRSKSTLPGALAQGRADSHDSTMYKPSCWISQDDRRNCAQGVMSES